MQDKNMKDKLHDTAERVKEKAAEIKGSMKVKAQNAKKNVQKATDSIKQKAAEMKGEMKERAKEKEHKDKMAKK